MAAPYRLLELQYSSEASFCENAESPASNTWSKRIPIKSYTLTTTQERIRDGGLLSRMNDESLSHLGPREAECEFTTYWPGHLTAPTGALTETWAQDLLSEGLGGGSIAQNGTTVSVGSTTTAWTVASGTTWDTGSIGRVGVKGDGRGDGQAFILSSTASNSFTSLVALAGAPASPDVVYGAQVAYHDENVALTGMTTFRFLVGYSSSPTTGAQYHLMGGQLAGVSFSIPTGGMPEITWRWRFAYWARSAVTIPSSSLSLLNDFHAPVLAGSMFIQDVGTATRATITPAEMTLTLNLGLEPVVGPGGVGSYQYIVGWQRTLCKPTLRVSIPWTTAYETWFDTSNASFVFKHILFTANPSTDGRSVGFYMPRVFPVGNRPSAPVEVNGQLYVPVTFEGREGPTTTTHLTRSAIRFFMG